MAYTSFTIELWMYAESLCDGGCSDNALFGQFEQNTEDRSLHFVVRQKRIYMAFYSDDLHGNVVSQYRSLSHDANDCYFVILSRFYIQIDGIIW